MKSETYISPGLRETEQGHACSGCHQTRSPVSLFATPGEGYLSTRTTLSTPFTLKSRSAFGGGNRENEDLTINNQA